MSKFQFQFHSDKFYDLTQKLEDLAKISDTIKIKIDPENILVYSIVGETILIAFKSYILNTQEYLTSKTEIESPLDIIISGAKRFVKNLGFIKYSEKIIWDVDFRSNSDDDSQLARFVQVKNGKFKIGLQGGETTEIRDITKSQLESRINLKNKKWQFQINKSEFQDIKKLASINSDGKVIHLNIEDGKVLLSELSTWEYQVDKVEMTDRHIMFNKTFLSSINDDVDKINFFVFDTFILTQDTQSNLMISIEQDFSVED
jgi:hypothetical protein